MEDGTCKIQIRRFVLGPIHTRKVRVVCVRWILVSLFTYVGFTIKLTILCAVSFLQDSSLAQVARLRWGEKIGDSNMIVTSHRFFLSQNALYRDSSPTHRLRGIRTCMPLFAPSDVVRVNCTYATHNSNAVNTKWPHQQRIEIPIAEYISTMEEVIVALIYLFAISIARDYFEKRYDRILSLLEDDINAETPVGTDERICIL